MPDVKSLLHRQFDFLEHALGIGSTAETRQDLIEQARQLRADIDALQPGAPVVGEPAPAPANPWEGKPMNEVIDAALAGDEDAQLEYRGRQAAAAASTATAAPAPGA